MRKLYLFMGLTALIVLLSETAWAADQLDHAVDGLLNIAWKFVEPKVIPKGLGDWAIPVTLLTLVWMLGVKQVRHVLGKFGGLGLVSFLVMFLVPISKHVWTSFMGLSIIFLILVIYLVWKMRKSIGSIVSSGFRGGLALIKKSWVKEPHWFWCLIGAIVGTGYLNGNLISNEETQYIPSMLSGAGGVATILFLIAKAFRKKGDKPKKDPDPEKKARKKADDSDKVICIHCGKPIRVGSKFCIHCHKPLSAPAKEEAVTETTTTIPPTPDSHDEVFELTWDKF